jgi:hypothetical protein
VFGGVIHTSGISIAALAGGLSGRGWSYVVFLVLLGVVQVSVGLMNLRAGECLSAAPLVGRRLVGAGAVLALAAGAASFAVATEAPPFFRAVGPVVGVAQLSLAAWTWCAASRR